MAKKRKSKGNLIGSPSGGSGRLSTDIDCAENGFIVNVSGDTGGKEPSYFSKRFIAATRPEALRIANSHLSGSKGTKKKAGGKKKIALKKG